MISRVQVWLAAAAVVVTLITAAAFAWRHTLISGERARAGSETARDFRDTTERMGDADVGTGDADDDLRWLDDRLRRTGGQ